jgi:hypothetical protein
MAERERPDPLLHSLLLFWEQIEAALVAVQPRRIVEIGSESGGMTVALADWAQRHAATLVSIDPDHAPAVHTLAATNSSLELVGEASPWALAGVGPADLWVIDGDHNHWTVSRELGHVFGSGAGPGAAESSTWPLAILHDVGWPWARRDLYYGPERIPLDGRHAHSFSAGVTVGDPGVIDGGFRGEGAFACALSEGGPANGVLTAVDDLMAQRPDLHLITLPCIFGVGFLFSVDAPWAGRLSAALAPLDGLELLATLEANRLNLYLRLIESQDDRARERAALEAERREVAAREALSAQVIAELETRVAHLVEANRALAANLARVPVPAPASLPLA